MGKGINRISRNSDAVQEEVKFATKERCPAKKKIERRRGVIKIGNLSTSQNMAQWSFCIKLCRKPAAVPNIEFSEN